MLKNRIQIILFICIFFINQSSFANPSAGFSPENGNTPCSTTCGAPKTQQDPDSCACSCPTSSSCAANKTQDPNSCVCSCTATCAANQTQDPNSCACSCTASCTTPPLTNQDSTTCACSCGTSCDATAIQNPATCTCSCPVGKVDKGGICCTSTQINAGGICCASGQVNANGVCCAANKVAANGTCCLAPTPVLSSGICCATGKVNKSGICCTSTQINAGGICCATGQVNAKGVCCASNNVDANGTCCVAPTPVLSSGICCPTAQHNSAGHCCASGSNWSSVSAVCCLSTQIAPDGTCCSASETASCGNSCVDKTCPSDKIWDPTTCRCKDKCYKTVFHSAPGIKNVTFHTNFHYTKTSGSLNSCLGQLIDQAFAKVGATGDGHGALVVTDSANGEISATGGKWYDDGATTLMWRFLVAQAASGCLTPTSTFAGTTTAQWTCINTYVAANYTNNKAYLSCDTNYVNATMDGKTNGFGGSSGTSCLDGNLVLDANCHLIKTSDVNSSCVFVGVNKITFELSTPLSLILDDKYDINSNISFVEFALNPSAKKNFWMWKGSEKSPLLVYDPKHQGQITSASQLFGNWTFGGKRIASLVSTGAKTKTAWANGFEALATLDSNFDGKVAGEELAPLALWFDKNQDGVAQAGEVRSLESAGIKSLSYKIDKEDLINKTVESSQGFTRELNGKTVHGRAVDWSSEGSDTQYDLLTKHLLGRDISSANEQAPVKTKDQVYSKEVEGNTGIRGIWSWNLDNNPEHKTGNQGFLIMNGDLEVLRGTALMEQPFAVKNGTNVDNNSMVHFSKINGTQQVKANGSLSLKFVTHANGASINNEATVDSSKKIMKGTSVAEYEEDGKPKTIKYSWTARKLEK